MSLPELIPVNQVVLDGNEKKYLNQCIESGWISSEGPFVGQFEEQFAARMGRKHGIAVPNGPVALDAAVTPPPPAPRAHFTIPTSTTLSYPPPIPPAPPLPVV